MVCPSPRSLARPHLISLIVACALSLLAVGCQADADEPAADTSAATDASDTANATDAAEGDGDDTSHNHTDDATVDVPDTTEETLCDVYCATAEEVCTGANRLYAETSTCLSACANMRQGQAGERTGNTVQCRIFHLELGRADPISHCPHAGESGANMCVFPNEDLCRRYCGAAMENCLNADGLFASNDACLEACFTITEAGTAGDEAGDSVHCRVTHAEAALTDPTTHCPAAAVQGSTLCVTP